MAAEAASLSIEIDSMSSGFIDPRGLLFSLPLTVIGIPSITYKGSLLPIPPTPLILTDTPPPGVELFADTLTPATLPCSALSRVAAVFLLISAGLIDATAPVICDLLSAP